MRRCKFKVLVGSKEKWNLGGYEAGEVVNGWFDDSIENLGLNYLTPFKIPLWEADDVRELGEEREPSLLEREVKALLRREIEAGFIGCPKCGRSWMWHTSDYECPASEATEEGVIRYGDYVALDTLTGVPCTMIGSGVCGSKSIFESIECASTPIRRDLSKSVSSGRLS